MWDAGGEWTRGSPAALGSFPLAQRPSGEGEDPVHKQKGSFLPLASRDSPLCLL